MITKLTTKEGYIYALIEWELVDKEGKFEGSLEYVLIKYIWAHDAHRFNGCIPGLIMLMAQDKTTHNAQFVGWERGARGRNLKWFPVHKILRRM